MSAERTAVVTGAAAGIGQTLAGALAAEGMTVVVLDIAPLEETEHLVEKGAAGSCPT